MANIRKYSLGLSLVLASLLANSAVAVPLFFERIHPDTKITRVLSSYNADTNIFTQTSRIGNDATSAVYRQDEDTVQGDVVTELEWSLTAEIDEDGNYQAGTGYFELFGAVDFEDASKTDLLVAQTLLRGGIAEFGIPRFGYEDVFPTNESNTIAYNILGLVIDSAPGIDYNGYLGMIWTDDPSPILDGNGDPLLDSSGRRIGRSDAQLLWGSDWYTEEGELVQAQADIFVVPAPSSILLFGLAFAGLVRSQRKVASIS